MARRKRTSDALTRAQTRSASLKSIADPLDLGNGLTTETYDAAIAATEGLLNSYNTKLSEIDGLQNQLDQSETELDDLSTRMLAAAGVKFGKDSDEYEKAGGTKTSERARPARTRAAKPADAAKAKS